MRICSNPFFSFVLLLLIFAGVRWQTRAPKPRMYASSSTVKLDVSYTPRQEKNLLICFVVVKLLSSSQVIPTKVGSVSNLYDSLETFPSHFMSSEKSDLLDPKFLSPCFNNTLSIDGGHYYFSTHVLHIPDITHTINTHNTGKCICGHTVTRPVRQYSNQTPSEESGYVKDTVTFIITDDLKITGSSTITTITLLNRLNIKDLTELEERTAIVCRNKALELLGASLVSTTVLNDVFGAEFSPSTKKVSAVTIEEA